MKNTLLAAIAGLILLGSACSLYRNDRMWIPDKKFEEAQKVYDQMGSLDLTRKTLWESHNWQRPEINEAIYRLEKLYALEQPAK